MRRTARILLAGCAAAALTLVGVAMAMHFRADRPSDKTCRVVDRSAKIWPDYADVTIPPNIAPLNFYVDEPGAKYCARIASARGKRIEVLSDNGKIQIPLAQWQALLQANRGEKLLVDVYVKSADGAWDRFRRITNEIAAEEIDPYLTYRLLPPVYTKIWDIGIYRRNLGNFEVTPVVVADSIAGSCVNCHTSNQGSTDDMLVQVRSTKYGMGPVVFHGGQLVKLDTMSTLKETLVYSAWHPTGRAIIFSANQVRQFYHTIGENRDVFDLTSRLVIYRFDTNRITSCPALNNADRLTTYPTWSPDGRYLYYCVRPAMPIERFREVRYDVMRIPYDIDANTWGEPEMILSAAETGKSAVHPRISPDGRYLVLTLFEYGNWPIYQQSADLWVVDLQTRQYRPMEVNSPLSDSWHVFSSNGRWIVFSSKRRDGLLARPYFCYFDAQGRERKPFLLPQEDPTYYDGLFRTFNVPEFACGPGKNSEDDFVRIITATQPVTPEVDPSAMP